MKALARSYLWWPGLDKDLESCVQGCGPCQTTRNAPAPAPLHPWLWPAKPWQRIHVDFAGPFMGRMFLIVVDAHSKWPEVIEMSSTTATLTIAALRRLFAAYGLPQQLVSDNGPQFTSDEFAVFCKMNGVKHIRTAPYHPSSNGLAERFVQTFKKAMKAGESSQNSLSQQLSSFLLSYCSIPHSTTSQPPSQLFLGRTLRTRLDLLRPRDDRRVEQKQSDQKNNHDHRAKERVFEAGQAVMVRTFRPGLEWVPGKVKQRLGPLTYQIEAQGQLWRRHVDHLRRCEATPEISPSDPDDYVLPTTSQQDVSDSEPPADPNQRPPGLEQPTVRHYPARDRHPPERYM